MNATYNPQLRQMTLPRHCSQYDRCHEIAHSVQRRVESRAYRAWCRFNGIRVIQYFVVLWIEFDAMLRARHFMEWEGIWSKEVEAEAWGKFMTYIRRKELT